MTSSLSRVLLPSLLLSTAALAAPPVEKAGTKPNPTDAEIAAIVVAANSVDIEAGQLARETSTNPEVTKFADLMITDHTSVNQSASQLVTRLGVVPAENESSKSLRAGGSQNLAKLKGLKGAAFDRAYVRHEAEYHAAVLEMIDQTLIPSARNAELKALIVKVRPTIAVHLEHARALEKSLEKDKARM